MRPLLPQPNGFEGFEGFFEGVVLVDPRDLVTPKFVDVGDLDLDRDSACPPNTPLPDRHDDAIPHVDVVQWLGAIFADGRVLMDDDGAEGLLAGPVKCLRLGSRREPGWVWALAS